MSLSVVTKKIEQIQLKGSADESDIQELITAAERSQKGKSDGVSNAEARALADFFLRVKASVTSKAGPAIVVTGRGMEMLNSFFIAHHLPYGDNAKPMMELVVGVLKELVFEQQAPKMEAKPRTGSLQPLRIDREKIAYLDAVKKQFVVKKDADFYGPFEMPNDGSIN